MGLRGGGGTGQKFGGTIKCGGDHHVLNQKGAWAAFSAGTVSQQACSALAPLDRLLIRTPRRGRGWESPSWENEVVVDLTVQLLERMWGTAFHSGEQRGHAGQLVSSGTIC